MKQITYINPDGSEERNETLDAERSVLGALLLDPDPADAADTFTLDPEAFGSPVNGALFVACRELYREGTAIDTVTLTHKLTALGSLKKVGGPLAVASLSDATPTAANLAHYTRIVREAGLRRSLQGVLRDGSRSAQDSSVTVADTTQNLVRSVLALGEETSRGTLQSSSVLMRERLKDIEAAHVAGVESTGLPTGFYSLDEMLGGGMQAGELLILAGRPSMGKTAAGVEVALNASRRETVLFVSLEMSAKALMDRVLSSRAKVDSRSLRSPKRIRDTEWPRLAEAFALGSDKLQVVDHDTMTVDDVRAKARTCKARHGLGLVVVDYLQLMKPTPGKRDRTREREVAEQSAGLKGLARELGVPVLCLAQLNRGVEGRDNKRPRLSDLRESGSLEQDADAVMFVHREAYYDKAKDDSVAEVIVAKQRNGPTGHVTLGWDGRYSRFYNQGVGQ